MKDLTGQKFGRLTAVCPTQKRQNGSVVWQCRCSCGNTAFVTSAGLSAGKTRSCGCLKKEMMPKRAVKEVVDLTGQRFGRLTVVRFSDEQSCTQQAWECVCDCGNKVVVRGCKLKNGSVKSCGCLRKAYLSSFGSTRANDITGQRFGRLTAIRPTEKRLGSGVVWECRCDCGNIAYVSNTSLKSGDTRSCGCLQREAASKTAKQYFGSCSKK